MLISHDKKFLFTHIQKTAGSSLTLQLSELIPDLKQYMGTHDHALWAKNKAEFVWSEYYKVAFVRNPWDRLVSWYLMITQVSDYLKQQAEQGSVNKLWGYVLENSSSFEEFLHQCVDTIDDIDGKKSFMFNQLDYVADDAGNIIVDFIGRFEQLEHDIQHVFNMLGFSGIALQHHNATARTHYRDYYNNACRRLVERRYAKDIDFFAYTF
jgi:hypothetical protein